MRGQPLAPDATNVPAPLRHRSDACRRAGQQFGTAIASVLFGDADRAGYDAGSGTATVVARIKNTSPCPGPATVELYLASPPSAHEPPKQLRGYQKLELAAGQSSVVVFRLRLKDLAHYDGLQGR